MKHHPVSRLFAATLVATAGLAFAAPAPAEVPMDYGLGRFGDIAAWRAAGSATPMDYGLGAYASLEAWRDAGAAPVATAVAQR